MYVFPATLPPLSLLCTHPRLLCHELMPQTFAQGLPPGFVSGTPSTAAAKAAAAAAAVAATAAARGGGGGGLGVHFANNLSLLQQMQMAAAVAATGTGATATAVAGSTSAAAASGAAPGARIAPSSTPTPSVGTKAVPIAPATVDRVGGVGGRLEIRKSRSGDSSTMGLEKAWVSGVPGGGGSGDGGRGGGAAADGRRRTTGRILASHSRVKSIMKPAASCPDMVELGGDRGDADRQKRRWVVGWVFASLVRLAGARVG